MTALLPLLLLLQPPSPWQCKTFVHGEGVFTFEMAGEHPLDYFTKGLYIPHPSIAGKVSRPDAGPVRVKVRPVGQFAEFDVLDVFYITEKPPGIVAKTLLLGRNGHFRPLLYLFHDGSLTLTPSSIVTVNDVQILMSRTRIDGSGHHWIEDYFILDEPLQKVVNLDAGERIGEELRCLLPPNQGVWKGGGFDIGTLTFSHAVWNEGDSNCCPTGDKVTLKFRIAAGRLDLESSSLEPPAN
ncbi:MAG TPA: hypothetical protein PLF84_16165 [Bryobacteraceae bacterium]|nr:hypothetical protein [Bryobacteraceae bacterium]